MGMFTRMSDIIQSNIQSMLDKAEDPEKVMRLMIQELEEVQVEVRTMAAKHIAEKKHLEKDEAKYVKLAAEWTAKAELAVKKNRDDLARAALQEKITIEQQLASLADSKQQVSELIEKITVDATALAEKLQEAKRKHAQLQQRGKSAAVSLKAVQAQKSYDVSQVISKLEQYEKRIDNIEAEADALSMTSQQTALVNEINQLSTTSNLESELAELKKRVA